jgi:two-component sensor histidine kinase
LISNALKHAFPDIAQGEIVVALYENEKDGLELIVKDNGIGLPPEMDFARQDSFGLSLVRILAAQLGGSINRVAGKGTEIKLSFQGNY